MADIVKLIYKGDEMAQWGWGSSSNTLHVTHINKSTWEVSQKWATSTSATFVADHDGFVVIRWSEYYKNWYSLNDIDVTSSWWDIVFTREFINDATSLCPAPFTWDWVLNVQRRTIIPIPAGTITVTAKVNDTDWMPDVPQSVSARIQDYFYFG